MHRGIINSEKNVTIMSSSAEAFFVNEIEFREELIYFIIVDRFNDGTSDDEERIGLWDRGDREGLYDKTWMEWGK